MKVKNITLENNKKFLRQRSIEVDFNDKNLKKEINILKNYCKETECFALASVQIGIPKRIIYIKNSTLDISPEDKSHDENKILINPIILSRKGIAEFWEACFSCGDSVSLVRRPYETVVEYYDIDGNKHIETFTGFESTVLSHEYDHLDGILHMDIGIKTVHITKEERIELRKSEPYKIISKTCDFEKENI